MVNILTTYKEVKVLHTMLETPESLVGEKSIPGYGGAYFFIANFEADVILMRAFGGKEMLAELKYEDILEVHLDACTRYTAVNFKKTLIFKFDIVIVMNDESIYYLESQDCDLLPEIIAILKKSEVKVYDRLGLTGKGFIEYFKDNIELWAKDHLIDNPRINDNRPKIRRE